MQLFSVCMSLIHMARVTATYQRFESQRCVGRPYPWASPQQVAGQRARFERTTILAAVATAAAPRTAYTPVPASEHVLRRFAASSTTKSLHLDELSLDDDRNSASDGSGVEMPPERGKMNGLNADYTDYSPQRPAPPPPQPPHLGLSTVGTVLQRMSTYRDMMLLRTELYLHDTVPRLPAKFHLDTVASKDSHASKPPDFTDAPLPLPSRRPTIDGLERDDFLASAVCFAGWSFVLLQRMLALAAFAYYRPLACAVLCSAHYVAMLAALLGGLVGGTHRTAERTSFYLFLAYVYIFSVMELRVRFARPRRILLGWAALVMVQNMAMSAWWFGQREHGRIATVAAAEDVAELAATVSAAWWFGLMFVAVLLSGVYALMCWTVYWFLLRPSARVLFASEREAQVEAERHSAGTIV